MKSLPRLGSVPLNMSCSSVICTTRSQVKRSQSPPVGEIIRGGSSPRPMSSTTISQMRLSGFGHSMRRGNSPISGNHRVKQKQFSIRKICM